MGSLLRGRRDIRAAGPLREVLSAIPLVDQHAHGILRAHPTSIDEFRGLFSESPDPRQWPHVATALTYRRAIAALAGHLGCEPTEHDVFEQRLATDPAEYASSLLRATGTEWLLVDDGYPPPGTGTSWDELGELAGCEARPIMRVERVAEEDGAAAVAGEVSTARERGFVALKTIAAYRGGLDLDVAPAGVRGPLLAALEANEATGDPLPVQVHCGFGDSDLHLPRADPGWLKPLLEQFHDTPFVLLHCYPFIREAGWLAHVYGHVWFDLSLTIPHVSRPAEAVREALELAPVSKLLYASDAARTPELYLLGATWWRDALAEVLTDALSGAADAEEAGRMILRDNALELYRPDQR
ncbi:MAG TPA: amidohydrolase family protein [Gaiellaceae bacterium]|nr:amidohydrolase family protein [Gaiellaceae bacterium]